MKSLYKLSILISLFTTLFAGVNIAHANGNYTRVELPKGVVVELPKNWTIITNNQRITLDSAVQAKTEKLGMWDAKSELSFAANYYDDQGKTAGIFNIRYYADSDVTQLDAKSTSPNEIKEFDAVLRQNLVPGIEVSGNRLLGWNGTSKQSINGAIAFITEYTRSSPQGISFRVRLVRFFNAHKSFTITISYREDQGYFLRPISDRIIGSIRI